MLTLYIHFTAKRKAICCGKVTFGEEGNQCNYDKDGHKSDVIAKTATHSSTKYFHHAALGSSCLAIGWEHKKYNFLKGLVKV